jgi:hypothetical protein
VEKIQTLADYLGTSSTEPSGPCLEDIAGDAPTFAKAVLDSREFRQYIVHGLTLGTIPPAILTRIMDLAGWVKPAKTIEHRDGDGNLVGTVTEVRRVIVHPSKPDASTTVH